jgi:hypothetical protein
MVNPIKSLPIFGHVTVVEPYRRLPLVLTRTNRGVAFHFCSPFSTLPLSLSLLILLKIKGEVVPLHQTRKAYWGVEV